MTEKQGHSVEVSAVVQQALGKLNVRLVDLVEQINVVIDVLVEESVVLQAKLDGVQLQQTLKAEST
ncbi:MAG: hypothetical protein FWD52_09740 [Candidatus Bathyarchaeota archaeon]|nr:hypothetical protein [Candidatus Termiticorpusculum sp.]